MPKISDRSAFPLAGAVTGTEVVLGLQDGADVVLTAQAIANLGPSGSGAAVETVGLFAVFASAPPGIDAASTLVHTIGYTTRGKGAAPYLYDAAVDAAYVTAHPRSSFLAADGRGFRLTWFDVHVSPHMFGCAGDGVTDDAVPFQAFLDYITATDVGTADTAGTFATSVQLSFGTLVSAATRYITGRCKLVAAVGSSGTSLLTIPNWTDGHWDHLDLLGTGVLGTYSTKTWATGLFMAGQRCQFGKITAKMFSFAGVAEQPTSTTTGNSYGLVKPSDCGSGARSGATKYGLVGNWSAPVRAGVANSTAQTTTVNVDVLPPSFISSGTFGAVNNAPYMIRVTESTGKTRLHYITAVDTGASKLTVFPWIEAAATPGVFDYVYGGGLHNIGANANVVSFDLLDAIRCGIALGGGGLYGPVGKRIIAQNCGTAVTLGRVPSGACLGTKIDGTYFENCVENIVYVSRPQSDNVYAWFGSEYAQDLSKCYVLGTPRTSTDKDLASFQDFTNTTIAYKGQNIRPEKHPYGNNYTNATQSPAITQANQVLPLAGNTFTINPTLDDDLHRLTGFDTLRVIVVGTGTNGTPTGAVSFGAPVGFTVNGVAGPVSFTGHPGVAEFLCRFDMVALNLIVTAVRVTAPRVTAIASSATPSINVDTTDLYKITALTTAITSFTSGLTGTPVDGQKLEVRIKAATALGITWGSGFASSGVATLLATTVAGMEHWANFVYDADIAKFVCRAVDAAGY